MTHNAQVLIATERERWLKLHLQGDLTMKELSKRSGFSRDTLHRWKRGYLRYGLEGLKEKSRAHRFHPKTTPPEIAARIRQIRQETRFCAAKIKLRLEKENICMSVRGIHRVLKRENLVRTNKRFPKKDTWIPRLTVPGELVEIDVAFMRRFRGSWLYQFTAIDSCTRWKYFWTTQEQSNRTAVIFLEKLIKEAPFGIKGIKTDNGSIFTNRYTGYSKSADPMNPKLHIFDRVCRGHSIIHYLIDPGKPAQNGKVERSHRTDREEFWNRVKFDSLSELKRKQFLYAQWYNNEREHLGIGGKTPTELLKSVRYDLA